MIFDTNSTPLKMAFFLFLFATTFLLSFQNLTQVPVIDSFPWQISKTPWKTVFLFDGEKKFFLIKNTSATQKQQINSLTVPP